jgi:hypothetical protein
MHGKVQMGSGYGNQKPIKAAPTVQPYAAPFAVRAISIDPELTASRFVDMLRLSLLVMGNGMVAMVAPYCGFTQERGFILRLGRAASDDRAPETSLRLLLPRY